MSTWWIPEQKRYQPDATLYCGNCEEIVPVEANPEWIAIGRPFSGERPAPEWFIRCPHCHSKFYQQSEGECPECGVFSEDEVTIVSYGPQYASGVPWDAHGNSWEETHRCWVCDTVFTFTNSDY